MKKLFILMLVSTTFLFAGAQTIVVKDKDSDEPLEHVTLLSDMPNAYTITNAKGQASIQSFAGSLRVTIGRLGYKTIVKSFDELKQQNFKLTLAASQLQFDEVVVSATKFNQNSTSIPNKLSVITASDRILQNPQTAADLLGVGGEVFIQKSQQGGGSPMIRGFATNRLLYTVDGVRMNSAIFRAGNIQNVISLDPFAIANTELFFGPSSVIYGSDAIGGVMSFQTITPQLSQTNEMLTTGKANTRFSSANNEFTNHFDIAVADKKWASVSSLTYTKYGDLKMGTKGPDEYLKLYFVERVDNVDRMVENPDPLVQNPSGYSQLNLMQKLRFNLNHNWDFQYGFHYSETSNYARYDRHLEKQNNGLPANAVWNYGPQKWMMNQITTTHTTQNSIYDQMIIRLAQQRFVESRIDRKFNNTRLRTNLEDVDAYSANLDFYKSLNKHKIYYGLEYVKNDVESKGSAVNISTSAPISVADRYPQSTWSSYAAYLNYQYQLANEILLQAGARYNRFEMESDFTRQLAFFPFDFSKSSLKNGALTGSLGLVFTPEQSWKISLNGSTGFRAPNVDDMGKIFDFAAGDVIVPNTSLKAEYAYNAELNVAKIFGDAVKLDISGFYTYLDNAMVRRPFAVNGQSQIMYNGQLSNVFAIQNAAFAKIYGFNLGLEIKLSSYFKIASKYNYQLGKEEMDNGNVYRSRHAAPAFGLTRLTFEKDKLQLQAYASYSAQVKYKNLNEEERQKPVIYAKDASGNPYSPKWYTLNFKAMYKFHNNFAVSTGIENLTDQRYRPYSSGLVATGRNFIIALNANF